MIIQPGKIRKSHQKRQEYKYVNRGDMVSKKILFNNDWQFTRQKIGSGMEKILKDESIWKRIDLPHDWVIYDTAFFHESGEGWYRKKFFLSPEKNTLYYLCFDGVYMDTTVYINGIKAGEWKYGYSSFEVDITNGLKKQEENEILVRVVLKVPNSRWYTGGGIYRNVWLKKVPQIHFSSNGIYISTKREENIWTVRADCEVCVGSADALSGKVSSGKRSLSLDKTEEIISQKNYVIRHTITDRDGNVTASSEALKKTQLLTVVSPKLWDITEPNLYYLKTELLEDNTVIDEETNRFGFRTIEFNPESGFYLNGRHVKIHGVCEHHDLGALGAAVYPGALKRKLSILREMGVNAIRTAHNMCDPQLLDLADEMGFLINEESFDMWERPKNTYDYARYFKDWAELDVASWIRRDRNHPCIIMWSIGNEIYDTHADERGQIITRYLTELVHKYDPYHNAFVTMGSNYMPWENARKCADIVKLAGYNYGEKYYEIHHRQHPDWVIYGSETGAVVQSRGIYHFPLSAGILCDDDEQCSSLGNSTTSWGAKSIEQAIIDDRDCKFSAGMFIWSGFDYIGEPTPYHTKNSYFGQIDTAGFKKDSFYIYQAEWTDYRTAPMVHLFPYWDFNEGQLIDVCVCSNAPKVELFLNGISQGSFDIDHKKGKKLIGKWRIPYQKGELLAVAYDENQNIIAKDIQKSFKDGAKIILKPDRQSLVADGKDLIFVEISMEDCDGNPVPNAVNRVNVKVRGAARLIGLDNGDSTDFDSYKGTSRRLFSGKLLAILAAKTEPGHIYMEVTSPGIPSAKLELTAVGHGNIEGISAIEENKESLVNSEVPIRKLEIINPMGTHFHEGLKEMEVLVKVYPENATYDDISWRVTTISGADSNIVSLTEKGKKAALKALGDGTFYLRATAKNGSKKVRLISVLEFQITGLGPAYYNPYEFVSASLYSKSFGDIGNGNERGIATSRDGISWVLFERLDFGNSGSDEITIPIFELESEPTSIEIWEGPPYEKGSELLAKAVYDKPSIWNTYQEETFKLNRKLTGIVSLAFLLRKKVHIKGFVFKKPQKAYERHSILSYQRIYGDSYTIEEGGITGIGNNVTIEFGEMDFGIRGTQKLIICGRSLIDKNSIHIRFNGKEGETVRLVEFEYSGDYRERVFDMDNITGLQKVSFVFLPGSHFDFKWFQFKEKNREI
jgi:beta-galactosidase